MWTLGVAFFAAGIYCLSGVASQCSTDEFAILYKDTIAFKVSKENDTCICRNIKTNGTIVVDGDVFVRNTSLSRALDRIADLESIVDRFTRVGTGSTGTTQPDSSGVCGAECFTRLAALIADLNATIIAQQAALLAQRAVLKTVVPSYARSCNEVKNASSTDIVLLNGFYDVSNSIDVVSTIFCDMATAGGGWTRVWVHPLSSNGQLMNLQGGTYSYPATTSGAMEAANEMMFGYTNELNELTGAWYFPIPAALKSEHPLSISGCQYYNIAAVRAGDGHTTTQYLRVGKANFGGDRCDHGCRDGRTNTDAYSAGDFGQICLTTKPVSQLGWRYPDQGIGNPDPFGYEDFPHYSGWAAAMDDACSWSNQTYAATPCSPARRFTILVR